MAHGDDDTTPVRSGKAGGSQGGIEVRLLAPVPDIAGLDEPLPSKRARRSTELIAYLAMHSPDPVTGDRLRTRVLGSSDADAAAKTLFNIAGAARRALGAGPDGDPLLPPAAGGRYRLSTLVEVDVRRMERLIASGLASSDPVRAFDALHEGLGLVRGEPLGGVLSGYGWWRAEGHERRVADAAVDAACTLVRMAVARGRLDIARWAIDQARLVEPYSEALTRAAMELAAARGDAWRLHHEWTECLRQADEVDPGGWPSAPTEQLYLRLKEELTSASPHGTPQRAPATAETQAFA